MRDLLRIIQIVFSGLDQHDLKLMIEVGQSASNHTTSRSSADHDDIDFLRNRHLGSLKETQFSGF